MQGATNIRIHWDTKKELESFGKFGDSHEDIIKRLIEECRKRKGCPPHKDGE